MVRRLAVRVQSVRRQLLTRLVAGAKFGPDLLRFLKILVRSGGQEGAVQGAGLAYREKYNIPPPPMKQAAVSP